MRKLILMLPLLAAALTGQTVGTFNYSATTGDVVLAGTGTAFTIQQPKANAAQVQLSTAVVYCSAACTLTQAENGAAATATAGTAYGILPLGPAAIATVWTASNAGAGTPIGGAYHLAAGERLTLDLSNMKLGNTGTGTNYTLTIATVTGTVNISLFWSERQ